MTGHVAHTELPESPGSVRLARSFIASTLLAWDCGDFTEVASLLTSELVTNAFLHARSGVRVGVTLEDAVLRVEVCDGSEQAPMVRPYHVDDLTGRGLAMVAAFSAAWGVERHDEGKCVWFELDH